MANGANGAASVFDDALPFISSQARIDLEVAEPGDSAAAGSGEPADEAVQVLEAGTLALSLGGLVDLAEETARLNGELDDLRKHRERVSRNLSNPNFVERAPEEVVERERERLASAEARIDRLAEILGRLSG